MYPRFEFALVTMASLRRGLVAFAVACALVLTASGCAVAINEDDSAKDPSTDVSEAASVGDVQSQLSDDMDQVLASAHACDKGPPDDYSRCFNENAKPIREAAKRTALRGLHELVPGLGPACRRAVRKAALAVQSKGLSFPEDALKSAHKTCVRESRASD